MIDQIKPLFSMLGRIFIPKKASLSPYIFAPTLFLMALLLVSCGIDWDNPPRLATATAQASATSTPEPLFLPAPTNTPGAALATAVSPINYDWPTLTIWINETSPEHEAVLQQMTEAFSQAYEITVELRLVEPARLPKLMETAVLSDTMPDLILHPLAYTADWAGRGILNTAAADDAARAIGLETFDPDAIQLVTENGQVTVLPSDGYKQILLYRTDWFAEKGLATPDNYQAMLTAAETITDTANLVYGFVIPTESNLITTHQAFEQIAAGNGCQLIDAAGQVQLDTPACRDAIDFYYNIVHQFSPPGVQTDTSAQNAYLAGRTGMIMGTPALLPKLAGLDPAAMPACAECDTAVTPNYLSQNTGIVTEITGRSETAVPAAYGQIRSWGITTKADPEIAATFLTYWFNEGYAQWLSVDSPTKVPMRWGTADSPTQFIDTWGTTPLPNSDMSLTDIYGQNTIIQLRDGIAQTQRWGYSQGQGRVMGPIYRELTFAIVLQEMLSGYFPPGQTITQASNRVIDLIPDYAFSNE